MGDDDLAAVVAKACQVGIVRAEDRSVLLDGFGPELFKTRVGQRAPFPFRILREVVNPIFERDAERLSCQR